MGRWRRRTQVCANLQQRSGRGGGRGDGQGLHCESGGGAGSASGLGPGPPKSCHRPSNPPPDHRCINSRKSTSKVRTKGMTVTRDVAATRQRVWDVLADGWTYSGWVVGNSRIRAVRSDWPAPGARILHSIGTWPAVIDDETGEELVLLAKIRPTAEARISLQLTE